MELMYSRVNTYMEIRDLKLILCIWHIVSNDGQNTPPDINSGEIFRQQTMIDIHIKKYSQKCVGVFEDSV